MTLRDCVTSPIAAENEQPIPPRRSRYGARPVLQGAVVLQATPGIDHRRLDGRRRRQPGSIQHAIQLGQRFAGLHRRTLAE